MKRFALIAGPVLFVIAVTLPAPAGLPTAAWHVAGVAAWMATWWLTAVVPLEATSLLPIVLLPLSGVAPSVTSLLRTPTPSSSCFSADS